MNTLGWNVTDQTFHHIYTQESQLKYQQSSSLPQSQLSALAKGFLHTNSSPGSCTSWEDEHVTANLVTGINPRNFYHFMFNIFQPISDTVLRQQASMHGVSLLQFLDQCLNDEHPACPQPTCAVWVHPGVLSTPFAYLLEALCTHILTVDSGTCFRSIQFALAHTHHMAGLPSSMKQAPICDLHAPSLDQNSSMFGCSDILRATYDVMSTWMILAVYAKHQQPMAHDSLAQLDPSQTVITVVDRLSNRLLLNKVALIEHALLDLKVPVLTTDFSHDLHDTIHTLQRTDILVAVHGQALANVMFMKPGSVVIEIFPYGWVSRNGSFWRCSYYRDMVEAGRITYLPYTNDNYSKSFVDMTDRPVDSHFLEMIKQDTHQEGKDVYVMMKNQNTEVDVSALQALLQVAANLLNKPVGRRFGGVCDSISNMTRTFVLHQCLADAL
ncbi:TPA: hypothetical protein ACH3X1_007171 [Trebouxia sp. C0004]